MLENTPTLETDRLILRRFTEADADAALAIFSDREMNAFLPWFPAETLERARAFLRERFLDTYDAPLGYRYAICLKEDDVAVGYVNLSPDEPFDFGYGLRHEFWGRGIATEAAEAVVRRIEAGGAVPFITATHDAENPASGAVMRKLGMTYHYSYEEQWMPKNFPVTFKMYQLNLADGNAPVYEGYRG